MLPPVLIGTTPAAIRIRLELVEAGSYELVDLLKDRVIDTTFSCNPLYEDDLTAIPCSRTPCCWRFLASYEVNIVLRDFALTGGGCVEKGIWNCPALPYALKPLGYPLLYC